MANRGRGVPGYNSNQISQYVTNYTSAYKEHQCGIHDLTYRSARPGCPLCEATRTVEQLRTTAQEFRNRIDILENENHKLKQTVDLLYAMTTAIDLLDEGDMVFLKTVLYTWRDEKSLSLKTTHGTSRGRRNAQANGFIVIPRKGEPYGHACSSVGGMAIAEYFDEAMNAGGPNYAMSTLARGLSSLLPGSARGN